MEGMDKEPWFFKDLSRLDAIRMLLAPGNTKGSFLIRESESNKGSYTLSVRDLDNNAGDTVKHYKIRNMDKGGFYITARIAFNSLSELVKHYSREADGLCTTLIKPCQTRIPQKPWWQDEWEIPRESLKLERRLGGGAVWRGIYNNHTKVAIKNLKVGTMSTSAFLAEANLMKNLQHPRLVRLYAVVTQEPIYIVTEFMANGSLVDFLKTNERRQHDHKHPHRHGISGKAQTLWLREWRLLKRGITSTGTCGRPTSWCLRTSSARSPTSASLASSRTTSTRREKVLNSPIKWTAPEAINYGTFSIKSDVWSFGILLTETVTYGRIPYPGMTNPEVIQNLERGYRMPRPDDCPEELYSIMNLCWQEAPEKRPTFEYLRSVLEDFFTAQKQQYQTQPC
ncbi:hypothetical protein SKAU_G00420040 [Synaphobranchus kaupii]|uniref:Tyrosine-protein kinase n=1 Tax=Synaphobranchus kaupii TaxID=118154 RepID=A0A9Q1E6F4_SYNKA|nr:hypothetical protein SKAU_G00420040 [Synaphobranchus kaupii]